MDKKHNLNHTNVYGCFIEVMINNPQLQKLNPRTTSGYFIGYIVNYKGYMFYFSSHNTCIVKAKNAKSQNLRVIVGMENTTFHNHFFGQKYLIFASPFIMDVFGRPMDFKP